MRAANFEVFDVSEAIIKINNLGIKYNFPINRKHETTPAYLPIKIHYSLGILNLKELFKHSQTNMYRYKYRILCRQQLLRNCYTIYTYIHIYRVIYASAYRTRSIYYIQIYIYMYVYNIVFKKITITCTTY